MQRGFEVADAYTDRAEKAGRYSDMEAELRALDAAQYDPAQERRDEMSAFLAGTANTTNFGSTMAGGTLASLNLRRKQQSERRERLKDVFDITERGMSLDITLANGGLQLGQQMYADAMANQREALSAATSMRTAELEANLKRAEMKYNELKDDRDFGLKERELTIQKIRNDVLENQNNTANETNQLKAALAGLADVQAQELKVHAMIAETSQLLKLQEALGYTSDPKKIQALRTAIDVEQKRVAVVAESVFDKMNGVQLRDELSALVLELSGAGSRMKPISLEDIAGIEKLSLPAGEK